MLKFRHVASAVVILGLTTAGARASLIADGLTYTLTESATANPLTDQFTLNIAGINGPSDTEGGRYGVQSFAFNQPSNFASALAPAGFTESIGGLNANGCNGTGNFYCFMAETAPTGPALPANTSINYVFNVTLSSGTFSGYNPDFKINWDGTKNNYDLISETLKPTPGTPVPEPGSLLLLGTGLVGLGLVGRRKISKRYL